MFCTACKTPFHWRTGEIMTHNSNPYFYEWMREQAAANPSVNVANGFSAPTEGACDNRWYMNFEKVSEYDEFVKENLDTTLANSDTINAMRRLPQSIAHNMEVVQTHMNVSVRTNEELRVLYLIGEIGEEKFKKELVRKERDRILMGELNSLFTMFNQVSSEIGLKVLDAEYCEDIVALIAERDNLCEFVTRSAQSISDCYRRKRYQVGVSTDYEIKKVKALR